jgi:predicted amino acid racemase
MTKAKLAKVSVEDLKKEIVRRHAALPTLIAERDALNSQIAELEGLGGAAVKPVAKRGRKPGRKAGRKAQRPPRPGSLAGALVEAVGAKGKLTNAEAAEAVLAAGYKSKSKDFQNMVSMMLSKDKRFKRVGRGVYALKATAIGQKNVDVGNAAPAVVKAERAGSLSSALAEAIGAKGKLPIAEAADAVLAAGYKSKSKDFKNIVSMTLSKDKRFKRVGRGVYVLKATAIGQKNVDVGNAAPAVVKAERTGSLSSVLVDALGAKGKFTVAEATDAVLATGYKSKSKAFPKIVRMTLLKGKQFKRVSRGVYALKG